MKKWLGGLMALVFGVLVSIAIAANVPETVKIEHQYTKKKKGPVVLSHKKHAEDYKIACTECHHKWKKEEAKQPKKYSDCHKEKKEGKTLGLKRAFHKNCMGCHKELKKQGKPTGPTTKCSQCHQKRS